MYLISLPSERAEPQRFLPVVNYLKRVILMVSYRLPSECAEPQRFPPVVNYLKRVILIESCRLPSECAEPHRFPPVIHYLKRVIVMESCCLPSECAEPQRFPPVVHYLKRVILMESFISILHLTFPFSSRYNKTASIELSYGSETSKSENLSGPSLFSPWTLQLSSQKQPKVGNETLYYLAHRCISYYHVIRCIHRNT
ncbi:hypothetical protein AVEN_86812-1 [Araneus ventricosus]|uniref:Uncharacterized protein n=1 Tax=Araneus ventricosus TaxID=182803 RepID=A0A4Y2D1D0_ARAVE|nr:hypothetical protein AVEN_86812-1 [Araneus ventricosus]